MSNIITYPTNPTLGQEFTVGQTKKVWDGEKWINKSFGNHETRLQDLEARVTALEDLHNT